MCSLSFLQFITSINFSMLYNMRHLGHTIFAIKMRYNIEGKVHMVTMQIAR